MHESGCTRVQERSEEEKKTRKRDFPGGPVVRMALSLLCSWVQLLVREPTTTVNWEEGRI